MLSFPGKESLFEGYNAGLQLSYWSVHRFDAAEVPLSICARRLSWRDVEAQEGHTPTIGFNIRSPVELGGQMKEIRLHGRGGQGTVMASQILVNAFAIEGKYGAAIPFFGFERRGAPVSGFVRLDDKPIRIKTMIYYPDVVVVLDSGLRKVVNVFDGIKDDRIAVLNEKRDIDQLDLPPSVRKVGLVDATKIALEVMGVPIANTAMLAAFAATTGWVKLESLLASFERYFGPKIVGGNVEAARLAYEATRVVELSSPSVLAETGGVAVDAAG